MVSGGHFLYGHLVISHAVGAYKQDLGLVIIRPHQMEEKDVLETMLREEVAIQINVKTKVIFVNFFLFFYYY